MADSTTLTPQQVGLTSIKIDFSKILQILDCEPNDENMAVFLMNHPTVLNDLAEKIDAIKATSGFVFNNPARLIGAIFNASCSSRENDVQYFLQSLKAKNSDGYKFAVKMISIIKDSMAETPQYPAISNKIAQLEVTYKSYKVFIETLKIYIGNQIILSILDLEKCTDLATAHDLLQKYSLFGQPMQGEDHRKVSARFTILEKY